MTTNAVSVATPVAEQGRVDPPQVGFLHLNALSRNLRRALWRHHCGRGIVTCLRVTNTPLADPAGGCEEGGASSTQ
jgi:hypothetical protein